MTFIRRKLNKFLMSKNGHQTMETVDRMFVARALVMAEEHLTMPEDTMLQPGGSSRHRVGRIHRPGKHSTGHRIASHHKIVSSPNSQQWGGWETLAWNHGRREALPETKTEVTRMRTTPARNDHRSEAWGALVQTWKQQQESCRGNPDTIRLG